MLPVNIEKAIEGLAKVTLRGGVVGKVTFSVVAIAVVIGVVAWAAGNIWLSSVAVVLISLIAFVMLGRVIDFADRNPPGGASGGGRVFGSSADCSRGQGHADAAIATA